jgi:hypothetical protein
MKLYESISKLPLGKFVDCYVDGRFESLILEGEPTAEEISEAWQKILTQFFDAMGTADQKLYIQLLKEVNTMVATINQANTLINVMHKTYAYQLGIRLNKVLGTNIKWPQEGREQINRHLKRCTSLIKPIEMKLAFKEPALKLLQQKLESGSDKKPTWEYFDRLLNLLEENFSVPIDYNIVTSRFCDKVKRMYNLKTSATNARKRGR